MNRFAAITLAAAVTLPAAPVLAKTAAPAGYAGCAYWPDGTPLAHWQKVYEREIKRPHIEAVRIEVEAAYARVFADSELCERNEISMLEYKARVSEALTRLYENLGRMLQRP